MFHLDNIDGVNTLQNGNNITHMSMIYIMQRRTCKLVPLALNLNKKTSSLTIKSNSFDEFLPYIKPDAVRNFVRTSSCSSFVPSDIDDDNKRGVWRYWLFYVTFL